MVVKSDMFRVLCNTSLVFALAMSGCTYFDAAHAIKEEAKTRLSVLNDHYARDVIDLAKTVPAGALARLHPVKDRCALAYILDLQLLECQFSAVPSWDK